MGREVVRGGSTGSISSTFGHAFRPAAEAASRNRHRQPAIERAWLVVSEAHYFVRRGECDNVRFYELRIPLGMRYDPYAFALFAYQEPVLLLFAH